MTNIENSVSSALKSHFESYEDTENYSEPEEVCDKKIVPLLSVNPTPIKTPVEILQLCESKNQTLANNADFLTDVYLRPLQGPLQRHQRCGGLEHAYSKNSAVGKHEPCIVNDYAFDMELNKFARQGKAVDPSDKSREELDQFSQVTPAANVGLREALGSDKSLANTCYYSELDEIFKVPENLSRRQRKLQRADAGDPATELYLGPWAPPKFEQERREYLESEAKKRKELYDEQEKAKGNKSKDESKSENEVITEELPDLKSSVTIALDKTKRTSILHIEDTIDFQGFSWVDKPHQFQSWDEDEKNYLPKK